MRYIVYILGVICLYGCVSQNTSVITPVPSVPVEQTQEKAYSKALGAISSRVSSNEDFVRCMDQSVNSCISSTVMLMARNSKDMSVCDELIDTGIRNACKQSITILNAREQKNVKLCETLTEGRVECRAEIVTLLATEQKNAKLCGMISTSISGSTNTPDTTEKIAKSDCMMQVIGRLDALDETLCEDIEQQAQRDMCKRNMKQRKSSYNSLTVAAKSRAISETSTQ